MVNDSPKKEYIIKAMEDAKVQQGYFVINNYWWKFRKMNEEAKKTADSYKIIGQGENVIFKYKISEQFEFNGLIDKFLFYTNI